jgi:tetratricopeptide (TPR) repeat protein
MSRARRALGVGGSLLALLSAAAVGAVHQKPSTADAVAMLEGYSRTGDAGAVAFASADDFVRLLQSAGTSWVDAASSADRERRRQTVALLVLESAAGLPADRYRDGLRLIEWACGALRKSPASEFERRWMLASASRFLRIDFERHYHAESHPAGTLPTPNALSHVRHALDRFPQEPRLRLARLLQRPEAYALTSRPGVDPDKLVRAPQQQGGPPGKPRIARTITELIALAGDPAVGAEALAHVGLLQFHLKQFTASRETLARAARQSTDPFVSNLVWLSLGLTLDAEGRESEATEAYRNAVAALPRARASAIQLASHLAVLGQRQEAAAIVAGAFGPDPLDVEPWRHVLAFDRLTPTDVRLLRTMLGLPVNSAPANSINVHAAVPATISAPRAQGTDAAKSTVTSQASPQTRFGARADAVTIDVLVESGGVPVSDLRAPDFQVVDNGRVQTVEAVPVDHVPVDVSLVVDFFNEQFIGRFRVTRVAPDDRRTVVSNRWRSPEVFGQVRDHLLKVSRTLKPDDRLRLFQVDAGVGAELWSFQTPPFPVDRLPTVGPGADVAKSRATYGRMQGVLDVAAAALLHESPPDRRHVVVVFTDGVDGASVLPPAQFVTTARHSSSVMYLLRRDTQMELAAQENIKGAIPYEGLYWPPDPRVIEEATTATGGSLFYHPHGAILPDFSRILDKFRRSYVLRYQPTDATAGWHDVTIRIARPGNFTVKARRGYALR